MKKNTASTTYQGQEYTPHFFESETHVALAVFVFFHSRVTRITRVVANLCESNTIEDIWPRSGGLPAKEHVYGVGITYNFIMVGGWMFLTACQPIWVMLFRSCYLLRKCVNQYITISLSES